MDKILTPTELPYSEEVEKLPHGVVRKWLYDRRILVYIIEQEAVRLTVDTWAADIEQIVQAWPADRPYLAVQEFTKVGLTPYNRARSETMARKFPPNLKGRHAIIIGGGILGMAVKIYTTGRYRQVLPNIEPKVTFAYDEGLAWVKAAMVL